MTMDDISQELLGDFMNDMLSQYLPQAKAKSIKILNAFSLNMLAHVDSVLELQPCIDPVDVAIHKNLGYAVESCVGHADTARLFERILGIEVAFNRSTVKLDRGDTAFVGQYSGPRLPEGAVELPEGAEIKWWWVYVK